MEELNSTQKARIILNNWVMSYGIFSYELTDNGPLFVIKILTTVRLFLGMKELKTTAYHPQTNGKVE